MINGHSTLYPHWRHIHSIESTVIVNLDDFYEDLCATENYTNTEAKDIQDLLEGFIRRELI